MMSAGRTVRTEESGYALPITSVGELLQNQFRIGLARMERVVRERMSIQDQETLTPQQLISIKFKK
jgi:DNA-directed RNA polymerase beta subunit